MATQNPVTEGMKTIADALFRSRDLEKNSKIEALSSKLDGFWHLFNDKDTYCL